MTKELKAQEETRVGCGALLLPLASAHKTIITTLRAVKNIKKRGYFLMNWKNFMCVCVQLFDKKLKKQ